MARYIKKPVVIEAFRLGIDTMPDWFMDKVTSNDVNIVTNLLGEARMASIKTLEGTMTAREGDFIIKGVKGELYPCKPDIFEATYESADTTANVAPIADTVRKMQSEIEKRCIKCGIYPVIVKNTINQIAKEMLECKE